MSTDKRIDIIIQGSLSRKQKTSTLYLLPHTRKLLVISKEMTTKFPQKVMKRNKNKEKEIQKAALINRYRLSSTTKVLPR